MTKPLEGVKVLDFSQIHGSSIATMYLADFGAEVIKIEKPGEGDIVRSYAPMKDGYSGYHAYLNRGKKSVAVDFSTAKGQEIIKQLVNEVDVVCENFRAGTLEKYGLGYDQLKLINPKLVYATLTGFGRHGDYKDKACFDNNMQAFSSMMEMSGEADGPPITMGMQMGNLYGSLHLALAINIALIHVHNTGEGQSIDVAGVDSLFTALEDAMITASLKDEVVRREGNASKAICPYDTYDALDGMISISVSTEAQWAKFCTAMNIEELVDDPRYCSNDTRSDNYRSSLRDIIAEPLKKMTRAEIEELMGEYNIPCGLVSPIEEAIKSEQTSARDMIIDVEDEVIGKMQQFGIAPKLYSTPGSVEKSAPKLGEDTEEYLSALGYSKDEISDLADDNVLQTGEKG